MVPDTLRHSGGRSICESPVVVVSSVNVPSASADHVPVTSSVPRTGADVHPRPKPEMSALPDTGRQEPATTHDPTTSPPQGATASQSASTGATSLLALPPVPPAPAGAALLPAIAVCPAVSSGRALTVCPPLPPATAGVSGS